MIHNHKHKCPECSFVWEHSDDCVGSDEAHKCPVPACNGIQFVKYWGDRLAAPDRRICKAQIEPVESEIDLLFELVFGRL